MRIKALLLSILTLTGSAPLPARYDIPRASIVFVDCGKYMGTAVRVGATHYLTAKHVVADAPCSIGGVAITNVVLNNNNDSATFDGPSGPVASYSCKGTRHKEEYVGIGYAEGWPTLTYEPLIASDIFFDGMQAFIGNLHHGMSGGPVVDKHGVVVGIVNRGYPTSGLEVRNTELCTTSMKH